MPVDISIMIAQAQRIHKVTTKTELARAIDWSPQRIQGLIQRNSANLEFVSAVLDGIFGYFFCPVNGFVKADSYTIVDHW